MKKLFSLWFAMTAVLVAQDKPASAVVGRIERIDPMFDKLVAPDAAMEKVAEGVQWAEGPLWFDGGVIFSDVPKNIIVKWKPGTNKFEEFLNPSGLLAPLEGFREPGSNGLARDAQGRLLLAQCGERRIARYENGKFTVIADRYDGKRFNTPNDLAVRKNGDIYFTDPTYGFAAGERSPLREIPFHGVYRVTPDGKVSLVASDINYPNGIAFSPDEKTLYVGSTDGRAPKIVAFDVATDGTTSNERLFFDALPHAKDGMRGGCDGMKVDREGNLWTTGPGGILIVTPQGKLIGRLVTGMATANCNWGEDGSVLYITASKSLLRLPTKTKGNGW